MNIYTVKDTDIVHKTSADFITRWCAEEVHIVQYDDVQPIVAVELFMNSVKYILPDGYEANLRFGKKDRTFIYKPVLGCNTERNTVYFNVDEQMSLLHGKVNPIIELTYNGSVVGSSPIPFVVDRNPVQIGDIQSKSDYPAIIERLSSAESSASEAKDIAADVKAKMDGIENTYATIADLSAEKTNRAEADDQVLKSAKDYADSKVIVTSVSDSFKINKDKKLELASVSTDVIDNGDLELILDGGSATTNTF